MGFVIKGEQLLGHGLMKHWLGSDGVRKELARWQWQIGLVILSPKSIRTPLKDRNA